MLLSMTGFGDSRFHDERLNMRVEVRTVNNRYLKVTVNGPAHYASLESEIEKLVRESIHRGTVTVTVWVQRKQDASQYRLNSIALQSYWAQLREFAKSVSPSLAVPTHFGEFSGLLGLPGVVDEEAQGSVDLEAEWPRIEKLTKDALAKLATFRDREGENMAVELRSQAGLIASRLEQVIQLAPQVSQEYRTRMVERLRQALAGTDATVSDADVVREVAIYADRADINEEITRLRSHLAQFEVFIAEKEPTGRKLDFLTQEMFREVNTIGSKANNAAVAREVVEMKAAVEKVREILQNVE